MSVTGLKWTTQCCFGLWWNQGLVQFSSPLLICYWILHLKCFLFCYRTVYEHSAEAAIYCKSSGFLFHKKRIKLTEVSQNAFKDGDSLVNEAPMEEKLQKTVQLLMAVETLMAFLPLLVAWNYWSYCTKDSIRTTVTYCTSFLSLNLSVVQVESFNIKVIKPPVILTIKLIIFCNPYSPLQNRALPSTYYFCIFYNVFQGKCPFPVKEKSDIFLPTRWSSSSPHLWSQ